MKRITIIAWTVLILPTIAGPLRVAPLLFQENRIVLRLEGALTNAAYDVYFAPSVAGAWYPYLHGTVGETNFIFPSPNVSPGFFRAAQVVSLALESDWDQDGVSNAVETARGTNPFSADSDGDGFSDMTDPFPLDPWRGQILSNNPADHTAPIIVLTEPVGAVLLP